MFKCHSNSVSKWLHNDGDLPYNAKLFYNQTLGITNATVLNKGHYECVGTNENGELFRTNGVLTIIGKFNVDKKNFFLF